MNSSLLKTIPIRLHQFPHLFSFWIRQTKIWDLEIFAMSLFEGVSDFAKKLDICAVRVQFGWCIWVWQRL